MNELKKLAFWLMGIGGAGIVIDAATYGFDYTATITPLGHFIYGFAAGVLTTGIIIFIRSKKRK